MSRLPEASIGDSLKVVGAGMVPALVRGLFSPRPGAMKLLTALGADERTVKVLGEIRRRHGGDGVRLLGGRIVVLWGPEAIREVLDRSADDFAGDSGAKGKGMSHFQPDALTLSRGGEWRDRRAFNEAVLATSEAIHPAGERFVAVAGEEVARLRARSSDLDWSEWERLFDRLTLRVVFGDRASDDREMTDRLERLMGEANRLLGTGESDELHELHGDFEYYLRDPEPGSLVARFADAPQSERTRVVHQLPHWIFATRDTLGANTFRALAVIMADPELEKRARSELEGVDLSDPQAVVGLGFLEGCLQEAMRLWPTVPLIARETTRDTEVAGERLPEGTQVMILNVFNHRDPDALPDADRLNPDRWSNGASGDYRFNHLSHGTQYCPGIPLVLLLGKAVLARILERFDLTLLEPELDPGEPLPHSLNFYEIRFRAHER
jgi:cytochrome P450